MPSSRQIGPYHPSQQEEVLPDLPESIGDPEEETPLPEDILPTQADAVGDGLDLPPIVLGCAVFGYGIYSDKADVQGELPLRTLRYALRCGVNAFDTSPWYHPSEIVMGRVLKRLEPEFPRSSYKILTKVGKYGPKANQHRYDAETVRASVERSLKRLNTDYLDVVYLHDVEFVTSHPFPCPPGDHSTALDPPTQSPSPSPSDDPYRLQSPHTPLGDGDDLILEGLTQLRRLQKEGKIRKIGIAGYPLPILLRLSRLAASTPSIGHIDIVQTYAHQTLQNDTLSKHYLRELEAAGVEQIMNAAPLAMGILTTRGGPDWHPVKDQPDIGRACRLASDLARDRGTTLEDVAVSFGFRELKQADGKVVPVVIGCRNIEEIQRTIKGWKNVNAQGDGANAEDAAKMKSIEDEVQELFREQGVKDVSWASVGPEQLAE